MFNQDSYRTQAEAAHEQMDAELEQMSHEQIKAALLAARHAARAAEEAADRLDTAEAWDRVGLARLRVRRLADAFEATRPRQSAREEFAHAIGRGIIPDHQW